MRLLVVEDERHLAQGIQRGLEADGFAVDIAFNGRDGLERATEGDYDVIVLDIMLPGMNGYKVCSSLREAGNWTPIIMLTAKDGELDEAEALDTGADDFLSKPFSYIVLVARIRALLRSNRRERPPVLEVGDLRLDPAAHRVWRGDVEVTLTPRQFSLLEYLMRKAGQVIPKAEILDHVWNNAFQGDPNNVEVYILHLRKRIDEPFGRHTIQTVRLVGYRLAADAASEALIPPGARPLVAAEPHACGSWSLGRD